MLLCFLACSAPTKILSFEESAEVFDVDGDGFGGEDDCDDLSSFIHPNAIELCDGIDNNCDGNIDEDVETDYYGDFDGDGFGSEEVVVSGCTAPEGYVLSSADCDDSNPDIYPAVVEVCDGIDNNCNDEIDEVLTTFWYIDIDGDGYGDANQEYTGCEPPDGYVENATDCDDGDFLNNPASVEICDYQDNDCDGSIDEIGSIDGSLYYPDTDGDGFGDPMQGTTACLQPTGYVLDNTDCDDSLSSVHVGAEEYCNTIDDNCDGVIDENTAIDASTWYSDTDGDGFGSILSPVVSCVAPSGTVADSSDCDDTHSHVYPEAQEVCDGMDGDCDGFIDAPNAIAPPTWYSDSDGDGFGDGTQSISSCSQPIGYVLDNTDCDDQNEWTYPGAAELDSLTQCMCDEDEDGFGSILSNSNVAVGSDCDDSLSSVHVGAEEYCNTIDDNCDGVIDENTAIDASTWHSDTDGDGFGSILSSVVSCVAPSGTVADSSDCDDMAIEVHPDAGEICDDSIDNNCNLLIDELDLESCPVYDFELMIVTDQINFNIDDYLGHPNQAVDIYIYIPSGVRFSSDNTSIPAFSTDGLPVGSALTLVNDGIIHGKGGKGACEYEGNGQNGGDAIWATVDMTIDTTNGGIYGGGGGGGSGDDPKGGGGGAGSGSGCDGGSAGDDFGNGGNGSVRNGGYGAGGSGANYDGSYALGGNWGVPSGSGSGGSGGAGGYCNGHNEQGQGGAGGGWGGGGGGGCAYSSDRTPGNGGEGGWAVRSFSATITWDGIYNTSTVKGWVQ